MDVLKLTKRFYNNFKGKKGIIGKTDNNQPIYYFAVEKTSSPKIIIQGAIHAREYVTTYLILNQIRDFNNTGKSGSVYFIPMLNPDGIKICLTNNPLYKANANGVDLNVNFDARFGTGAQNVFCAGSENYVGKHPFCQKETRAIRDFTLKIMPDATISYHSKGEEIYYEFFQDEKTKQRDYILAKKIAQVTGYTIKSTPNSAGGYKDWCIEKLHIPALTIEVGADELTHPLGKECLDVIYKQNKKVVKVAIECLTELKCKKSLWIWQLKKR